MSAHPLPSLPASAGADHQIRLRIEADTHVVTARQHGRLLATQLGFSSAEATIIATAISELARNILIYAMRGEILLTPVERDARVGILIAARDEGRGIVDIQQAMEDGYSTSGRLGVGLPGVKRLMDDFHITSELGHGTTVTVTKWRQS
jgi:serine/threonine-protein kinase RsbT